MEALIAILEMPAMKGAATRVNPARMKSRGLHYERATLLRFCWGFQVTWIKTQAVHTTHFT